MDKRNRWYKIGSRAKPFLIVGGTLIVLFVMLQNLSVVIKFFMDVLSLLSPFLWGIALAYLLSLLMVWLERRLFSKIADKKLRRLFSLFLTLILFAGFFIGLFYAVMPQLTASIASLIDNIPGYITDSEKLIMEWAQDLGASEEFINSAFGSWEEIIKIVTDWVRDLIPGIALAGIRVGVGIINGFISLFVAIYILIDMENLLRQLRNVSIALFGEKHQSQLESLRMKCHKAFGSFLIGRIIDSSIVAIICLIFMLVLNMPYTPLITFIIGITNIIPTFGPFIGAIPSLLILFMVDPLKALWFLIFIIILQLVDGNVIMPYIMGDVLGLSALWILFAVVFFGSLWGVMGMVIGVPIFAVIYDLVSEAVQNKLKKMGVSTDPNSSGESHDSSSIKQKYPRLYDFLQKFRRSDREISD